MIFTCMDEMLMGSSIEGDSGGPVYMKTPDGEEVAGIQHGYFYDSNGNKHDVYSPIGSMMRTEELGTLTVTY